MLHQSLLLLLAVVYFHWHRDVGSGSHFDFMTILSGYNTPPHAHPSVCCYGWPCKVHSPLSGQRTNNATQDSASVLIRKGSQRFIALCFCLTLLNMNCFWRYSVMSGSYDKCEGGGWYCPVRKWVRKETNCSWIMPDMLFQCKVRLIHF